MKIYFIAIGLLVSISVLAQLPTATEVAKKMIVGCNIGNTLEVPGGETGWGNPMVSQKFVDGMKAAGFNTVRIPCSWDSHADAATHLIAPAWLARVKEVVDYCLKNGMYTIINTHWDSGWLENNVTPAKQVSVNIKQKAYWTQIANYFKDYDEHLLFASANEPNVSDATGMSVLMSYHQTFIDAVRGTGANNSSRVLVIQGPSTDIVTTNNLMTKLPTDQIANRMIIEIHYYTPWNFCGMDKDESWGNMFYYWGKGYHSTTDAAHNATWGEESDVEKYFGMMKTQFVDKGIPVIIGEFGAMQRSTLTGTNLTLHLASRQYYYNYVVNSAIKKGLIPIVWDTGALLNRNTGAVSDANTLNGIMLGAGLSYSLTTSVIGSGTIIKNLTGTAFLSGTTISLTAAPAIGYRFTGWSGDLNGTTNPTTITINANKTAIATFTSTVGIETIGENNVEISPNPVTNNMITIKGLQGLTQIKLIDINGKVVQECNTILNESYNYNLCASPGFYMMQIINGKNTIQRKLIIK
jgi:endoglucanase